MNAIPSLQQGNKARAQQAFSELAKGGLDFDAAHREGWTVAEAEPNTDGTPGVQLQRLDTHDGTAPLFPGDREAWIYVVARARARAGSERHQLALTLLDSCERLLIEATCGPL